MARLNVNPTRMELSKLKKRLTTARRGHKLLKDKRDELMKQFLDMARKNKEFRREVEKSLESVYQDFVVARAVMSSEAMEAALMYPKQSISVDIKTKNIMSINVPQYEFDAGGTEDIFSYGFSDTSGELDNALITLSEIFPKMLELAQLEKAASLLAQEIEKTRRRVNALEHVMIPQLEETIKFITMKLDENERGNITRLMKVKDLMIAEQIKAKQ